MDLEKFYNHIDQNQDLYVQRLREAVAIPSVSGDASYRNDVFRMGDWLIGIFEELGINYKAEDIGTHELDGQTLKLPKILLGSYGNDPNKKTILVYGHYDVQPALKEDGWGTDPWELVEDSQGRLLGRGSSDDKGPIIGWLNTIEAYQKLELEFPVNLKICFEGMEESGSEGIDDLIVREAKGYFKDVDCVTISDNYWLGTTKPCLTYGLRGISYFKLTISGPGRDLHSGVFGGTVHEPMTDLAHLFSKLVKADGHILIPGIYDDVAKLDETESNTYKTIQFKQQELHDAIDSDNSIHDNEIDTLMHRWRYPTLSLHGIEGAFSAPGAKTVIPAKVIGKFSIRTVPNMDPDKVTQLVTEFLDKEFAKLGSKNKMKLECIHDGKPWVANTDHWNYVAAAKAVEKVYHVKPDLTREGGSIPVTLTFQEALGDKNVLLLPMGRGDDGAHSINEKLDRSNYINGIKLFGTYLHEVAHIKTE
ncbi:1506_t:CDS:10 [Ambispora leptoticha]|uniref:1506_t:CDS:1 n=1 Tax=Ambispora leptoticha TaxID=144679 RepID=A0A9N9GX80_9GLOM|nr:1506_t:CDS:10 [Ambispora leptoticha]